MHTLIKQLLFTIFTSYLVISFTACSSTPSVSDNALQEPLGEDIPAYFSAHYMTPQNLEKKLKNAGFQIAAEYHSKSLQAACKKCTIVVFTNDTLLQEASKQNRGFIATLRILVDEKHHKLHIMNPLYFAKAFMQEDFDYILYKKIQKNLLSLFENIKASKDAYLYDALTNYHFMMAMPGYEDMITLASGVDTKEIVRRADNYKKGKYVIYKLKLNNNSYLYGYDLTPKTTKFIKKTGLQNAEILPYQILVKDSEAKMLNVKYYLALAYPKLTMGEFMNIATLPGAIERDLKRPFK